MLRLFNQQMFKIYLKYPSTNYIIQTRLWIRIANREWTQVLYTVFWQTTKTCIVKLKSFRIKIKEEVVYTVKHYRSPVHHSSGIHSYWCPSLRHGPETFVVLFIEKYWQLPLRKEGLLIKLRDLLRWKQSLRRVLNIAKSREKGWSIATSFIRYYPYLLACLGLWLACSDHIPQSTWPS